MNKPDVPKRDTAAERQHAERVDRARKTARDSVEYVVDLMQRMESLSAEGKEDAEDELSAIIMEAALVVKPVAKDDSDYLGTGEECYGLYMAVGGPEVRVCITDSRVWVEYRNWFTAWERLQVDSSDMSYLKWFSEWYWHYARESAEFDVQMQTQ